MPTPAHPAPPTRLPEDSLGYALLTSAELIAEAVGGTTLTDALARVWAARPATPAGVRGAILDLTYGTLRDYGRQDFILGKLLQKPLPEPVQSLLRVALRYPAETAWIYCSPFSFFLIIPNTAQSPAPSHKGAGLWRFLTAPVRRVIFVGRI